MLVSDEATGWEIMRATEGNGGLLTVVRRFSLQLSAGILFCALLLTLMAPVAVGEDGFEIVISIDTIVRAPEGSETVLRSDPVQSDLVGEMCSVIAESQNQSSVHPGNDLIVESQTQIVLADVEAVSGGIVTATDNMVLGDEVVISLVMGRDEVFSAGIDVLFDCPPETTTTTAPPTSTTTTPVETTTTVVVGSTTIPPETTTTVVDASTTTTEGTPTTTPPDTSSTTTVPGVTTTTVPDEVLTYTGPPDGRLALLAFAMVASGALVLASERTFAFSEVGALAFFRRRCKQCDREAVFMTPHGRLCKVHTRKALNEDEELWMPSKLDRRKND
jgi:hypothetical protein